MVVTLDVIVVDPNVVAVVFVVAVASAVVLLAMAVSVDCSEHALSINAALTAVVIRVLRIEISLGSARLKCFYAGSALFVALNIEIKTELNNTKLIFVHT